MADSEEKQEQETGTEAGTEHVTVAPEKTPEEEITAPAPKRKSKVTEAKDSSGEKAEAVTAADDSEEDDEEKEFETVSEGEDFDLAYDFEHGEPIRSGPLHESSGPPWKAEIESPKEFFNTEILYRYDILEVEDRTQLAGKYRFEIEGTRGGVWTISLGDDLEVFDNSEMDVDVTLQVSQRNFLQLVNGELNPQLAFLSQKVTAVGNISQALQFQSLLCPQSE